MAFQFTDANFAENTMEKKGVAVIDFWAEWCGPCRAIAPVIEELATQYDGKVLVGKMDVDSNQDVPFKYGVRSIPTILILKDGEIFDKQVGLASKQLLADKIEKALNS